MYILINMYICFKCDFAICICGDDFLWDPGYEYLSYSNKLHRGGVFVWGNWGEVWGVLGVSNLGCRGQSFF
jgi:hypothetical protein